jgi:hypothetical protein
VFWKDGRVRLNNKLGAVVTTTLAVLQQLIASYLAGELPLPEFWTQFTFTWADADESNFSPSDEAFFGEVSDRLHYVDFSTPAEAFLAEPNEFREWLADTVARRGGT